MGLCKQLSTPEREDEKIGSVKSSQGQKHESKGGLKYFSVK